MELCGGRDVIYCPMCDVLFSANDGHKCEVILKEVLMHKCTCQECGEEFECEDVNAKLCDDCIEEAEEYDDSEYEE